MAARRFALDVESSSPVDLAKAGADAYWSAPETVLICVCYRIDNGPVVRWRPGDPVPYFVPELNHNPWRIVAHNWMFELSAWVHVLGPKYAWTVPRLDRWDCTMARALYWGLPAGLADVSAALALAHQIDPAKKTRIKRMARPRSLTPLTWWHEMDPVKLAELVDDCAADVLAECDLDDALPPLPDRERRIFLIDGEANRRGVRIDLSMVHALTTITTAEGGRLNERLSQLTAGRVRTTNQTAKILAELLQQYRIVTPDLTKETVALAVQELPPGTARDILACRAEAAKASTGKLRAMAAGASPDGRCRGLLQYAGAGRTLRWAGRRVQPQNYPRGTVKGLASVFAMVARGVSVPDLAALLPGAVLDCVASMLRGCMIATAGHLFVSGDLAQIEARVLPWLAGQRDVLRVFARGDDVYTWTAAAVGSHNRQFGKVLVLACGFGMGAERFRETAATYGVFLSLDQADDAVQLWRVNNSAIVRMWWDTDAAFRALIAAPHGSVRTVGKRITLRKTRKAIRIVLPSGNELTYHKVALEADQFGRESIVYWGVNSKTKRWEPIRTYGGRLVENIVQATARDALADAMIRHHDAHHGRPITLTVHDEILTEAPIADAPGALRDLLATMSVTPEWAPGLPLAAEGWIGERYRK